MDETNPGKKASWSISSVYRVGSFSRGAIPNTDEKVEGNRAVMS